MNSVNKFDGREYQARIDALTKEGTDMHGEASLVRTFRPNSVLDAGCGTGRVAIELARHGIDVVGADIDESMIAEAKHMAPELQWIKADLATLALGRVFDVVVLAGNVPLFCEKASRPALITSCAEHVVTGGLMVTGFQLNRGYALTDFDQQCTDAGLTLLNRWATWDGQPFGKDSEYVVSIHRREANS